MGISISSPGHAPSSPLGNIMMFIDGENLTLRYQEMLKDKPSVMNGILYFENTYVWHSNLSKIINGNFKRILYYTYIVGDDDKVSDHEQIISSTQYDFRLGSTWHHGSLVPRVLKKKSRSQKRKGVDINISVDILTHVYNNSVDTIFLITGDGDYKPVIQEAMRMGKRVIVGSLSSGLSPVLQSIPDRFILLDEHLLPSNEVK